MNKQELIERIEDLPYKEGLIVDTVKISRNGLLKLIEQLDEPKPVKVPPFVAVWYEINKENFDENIAYLCLNNWGEFINDKTLFNWMSNTDNFIQILVNMHQFGYEVEKEKRYLVKIKASNQYIMSNPDENAIFFYSCRAYSKLTRKELEEAGFGWVFDCEGIEVEEVE